MTEDKIEEVLKLQPSKWSKIKLWHLFFILTFVFLILGLKDFAQWHKLSALIYLGLFAVSFHCYAFLVTAHRKAK